MGEVLALQPDAAVVALLEEESGRLGARLHPVEEHEALERALQAPEQVELLVVGTGVADPVSAAQRAFRAASRLPVLLLTEPEQRAALMRKLAVTPFISTDVRCVPVGDLTRLREALGHALHRSRQRRQLRQVVASANAQLAAAPPPPLPAPASEVLDRLLQLAPVGVVATDLAGEVRACNARAAALLSLREEQLLGKVLQLLLPAEERAELERALGRAAVRVGAVSTATLRLPGEAPGDERHVELCLVRLAGRGASSGYLLVLQDATERTRLMGELKEAVRVRDEFVAVAAHELNTPLTALSLHVQRLLRLGEEGAVSPETVVGRTQLMERSVLRLSRLVSELMDVTRITTGKLELQREPVELRKLVQDVLEQLAGAAAQAGCELRLSGPEALEGNWDPLRLEQVAMNLVSNALKFGAGQPVEVELAERAGTAQLTVRDHGPGIPEHEHQRIFERFERAASTRHHGGLGLGLWISRQIVLSHGGEVQVDSAPGQGAAFSVTLPRQDVV
ncbi:MAG TPA: ATP-binding protein [Aggregicoccus sp.]|nr:ATP-binding protein [Aggregicoccus sp.]